MKTPRIIFAAFFLAAAVAAQQSPPQLPETASIRNYLRVNETICTGGQPTAEEMVRLKASGVRAILNLRRTSEYDHAAEEQKAKELGLRYVNIPVNTAEPAPQQVEEFLKALRDPALRPAFLHCGTANRVGAFWMIYRVLEDKWSVDDAEAEARKIGMRDGPARDFALKYIEGKRKPQPPAPPTCC